MLFITSRKGTRIFFKNTTKRVSQTTKHQKTIRLTIRLINPIQQRILLIAIQVTISLK
jgi:hypothetical protein